MTAPPRGGLLSSESAGHSADLVTLARLSISASEYDTLTMAA